MDVVCHAQMKESNALSKLKGFRWHSPFWLAQMGGPGKIGYNGARDLSGKEGQRFGD
jgi:hypothetical protein